MVNIEIIISTIDCPVANNLYIADVSEIRTDLYPKKNVRTIAKDFEMYLLMYLKEYKY